MQLSGGRNWFRLSTAGYSSSLKIFSCFLFSRFCEEKEVTHQCHMFCTVGLFLIYYRIPVYKVTMRATSFTVHDACPLSDSPGFIHYILLCFRVILEKNSAAEINLKSDIYSWTCRTEMARCNGWSIDSRKCSSAGCLCKLNLKIQRLVSNKQ